MSTLIMILLLAGFTIVYRNAHATRQHNNPTFKQYTMTIQSQLQNAANIDQYGAKIAEMLYKSNWDVIVNEIYPINLPKGWQDMVKPTFEEFFGLKLSVDVIAFKELPDYQLQWLKKAPEEVLNKTQQAIRISFDHPNEEIGRGKLELAIYQHDDTFSILMVGDR